MKKFLLFALAIIAAYANADNNMSGMNMSSMNNNSSTVTNTSSSNNMDMGNMMYMDFGLGYGTTSSWSDGALAVDMMNMGFYYNRNVAAEIGMGMLPNGTYQGASAMDTTVHLAAKGILPLAEAFSLYGKAGVGVSMGSAMPNMQMITPTNAGLYLGVGVQFNLAKHFALYVEDSGIVAIPGNAGFGSINQTTAGLEIRM